MMEDGLAKQLKTIRKSYEERIRAAKENGAKVNEVVAALNKAMEKELQRIGVSHLSTLKWGESV